MNNELIPADSIGAQIAKGLSPAAFECGANFNKDGFRLVSVKNDIEAANLWLNRFKREKTRDNYRKEVERFLLWADARKKSISSLSVEDVMAYKDFLAAPDPEWINPVSLSREHPEWRPFRGALAERSIEYAMTCIQAMMEWLVSMGYLRANIVKASQLAVSQKRSRLTDRYLHESVIAKLFEAVETVNQDPRVRARNRWLIALLYLSGMRVSEAIGHSMAAFRSDRDTEGKRRWYLSITGKGGKVRQIPASEQLMQELARYRVAFEMTATPAPDESVPLVQAVRGKVPAPITRQQAHLVVKQVFAEAASSCDDPEDRIALEKASAHWLRHSRGSHLVASQVPLNTVREFLGHADLTTTSMYIHDDRHRMHDQIAEADQKSA